MILAGMLASLCVESHLRELPEQGFEIAVVKDPTAAPRLPEIGDGYRAALVNYGFIANAVLTTDNAVEAVRWLPTPKTPEAYGRTVMSQKLAGKIALVTGGTSGLGLATARRFVAEGAKVVLRREPTRNEKPNLSHDVPPGRP